MAGRLGSVPADRRTRLASARLYLVCGAIDDRRLAAAIRGGVQIVQLRCKQAADAEVLTAAARFRGITAEQGVLLIVNDRPDLALRADADGVHLGQDDAPVAQARALLGPDRLIGLSTHTPAQVDSGRSAGIDYTGVGPVHATPTKPGRPAAGYGLVGYAAAHAEQPFFAIGGIDTGNVQRTVAAGAGRIAVVRAIADAQDPELAARALRAALEVPVGTA